MLVLVLLSAAGFGIWAYSFRAKPIPVTVHRVSTGVVEDLVVNSKSGSVRSRQRARLLPSIGGIIVELPVKEGEFVRRGDLLLRLDDDDHRAQVTMNERARDAARAAEKQVRVEAEHAAREVKRYRALLEEKVISEALFDQTESHWNMLLAQLKALEEKTHQASASLAAARTTWEKTRLTAPFDGVIAELSAEMGEWVGPSPSGELTRAAIDLFAPDSLYVSAPIDEVDLGRVREGQKVRIRIDAYPEKSFPGRISRVAPYVLDRQEQNRTLEVEAEFASGGDSGLMPGATADVEIILESRPGSLRIPTRAVLEGSRVLVVRGDELVSVPIRVGMKNWEFTEVLGGLAEGDAVVVSLDKEEIKAGAKAVIEGEER